MTKPPTPARAFDPWPRIDVDTTDGTETERIIHIATRVANDWVLGEHGPYRAGGMTMAEIVRSLVHESLLHLLELGLIDIDAERLNAAPGVPVRRRDFRGEPAA